MSAISSPTPSPAPPPGKVAPPLVEPPPERRARWKLLLVVLGVVAVGAFAVYELWLQPQQPAPSAPVAAIRTARVTAGPMERVERVSGITNSINYVNIRAPRQRGGERMPMLLLELLPSGAKVKKGDVVARIDDQSLRDHIDDVNAMVIAAEADVKKRRAEQEAEWSSLEQSLRLAELRILEITQERHTRHRDRHIYDLRHYTIKSPMDGMVVRQQIFRSGQMQIVEQGDQIRPGMLFLKVMDTDHMQVEANISQADSSQFRIGQQARVGLDAFPGLEFKGRVRSIGALAKSSRRSQYVRRIPINITIEGSDPRLIPDLSAYADIILDRVDNAKHIPLGAVHEDAGQAYVYVKQGEKFTKRPVELGFRNHTDVAVVSGLEVGEEVALDLPVS